MYMNREKFYFRTSELKDEIRSMVWNPSARNNKKYR